MNKFLVILFGPTAVGKTDLSISLAQYFDADIFSCDSRQFFKELNIGVAKPTKEQLETITHHFVNNISIYEHYSISKYEQQVIAKLDDYFKKHNVAIMCGGSGLYIDAVCNGIDEMPDHDPIIRNEVIEFYQKNGIEAMRFELKCIDPDFYEQVDLKNAQRIMRAIETFRQTGIQFSKIRTKIKQNRNFNVIKIYLDMERNMLYEKINLRVLQMFEAGLLEEAKQFYQFRNLIPLKTIGYREIFDYMDNKFTLEDTIEKIKLNTRRYAKRQLTWFNRYKGAFRVEPNNENEIKNKINKILTINTFLK